MQHTYKYLIHNMLYYKPPRIERFSNSLYGSRFNPGSKAVSSVEATPRLPGIGLKGLRSATIAVSDARIPTTYGVASDRLKRKTRLHARLRQERRQAPAF